MSEKNERSPLEAEKARKQVFPQKSPEEIQPHQPSNFRMPTSTTVKEYICIDLSY